MKTYVLVSTPMIHTPSIFRMCKDQWVFPQNRRWVKTVLAAYNIPNPIITKLMNGKIPHRIEDESVVFECESLS